MTNANPILIGLASLQLGIKDLNQTLTAVRLGLDHTAAGLNGLDFESLKSATDAAGQFGQAFQDFDFKTWRERVDKAGNAFDKVAAPLESAYNGWNTAKTLLPDSKLGLVALVGSTALGAKAGKELGSWGGYKVLNKLERENRISHRQADRLLKNCETGGAIIGGVTTLGIGLGITHFAKTRNEIL